MDTMRLTLRAAIITAGRTKTAGAGHCAPDLPLNHPPRIEGSAEPSDCFLEILGGAERDLLGSLDLDCLAGRRIAAHARGAFAHLEDAEPADADTLAFLQVLHDITDEVTQNLFGLLLRHLMRLREGGGEMLQRHSRRGR